MRMHKDEIIELLESLRIKEDITDSEKTLSNINKIGSEYSNSLNDPSIHENGIPFHIYDDNNETITLTTESQQVCGEDKAMKEKVEELTLELRKKQEAIDSLKQQLEDANALISSLNQKIEDLNNLDDELNSNDKRRLDFGLTTGTWAAIANGLALFGTNYTKEKIAVALHDFTGRSAQRIRTETPSSKDIDKAKEFLQNIKNKI